MLDPDRARTDEFQGVHIDLLNVVSLGRRCGAAEVGVSGEQLGGDVLGVRFERRRAIGRQLQLAAEDLLDAPAQRRPVALGGIEMASQIEQGALTHFVADAFGAHEAVGEIGLAGGGGTGLGAPDEHGTQGSGRRGVAQYLQYILWHYIDSGDEESISYMKNIASITLHPRESPRKMLKMG